MNNEILKWRKILFVGEGYKNEISNEIGFNGFVY